MSQCQWQGTAPGQASPDPGGKREASSCKATQPETATGSESGTCTGWDRGCQSSALWDIVCLALPFVSGLWNACPREERTLCAWTTFPSLGKKDVKCPQLTGILLPVLGNPREAPSIFQYAYLISCKKEPSCEGCTLHWQKEKWKTGIRPTHSLT